MAATLFFDNAYEGTPTWDLGRPQPAIVRLASVLELPDPILDVGCGTGENALHLASLGHFVVGVDFAVAAIEKARAKADARGLAGKVEFAVADALALESLGRTFRTAIDSGLFHCLQPADRRRYAASLAAVLEPGAAAHVLCWSVRNPLGFGPERIRKGDIRATFRRGWSIEAIEPDTLESRMAVPVIHAWLARVRRAGKGAARPSAGPP